MDTIYFDWSIRRGVMTVRNDETEYHPHKSLSALFDSLTEPTRIIGEATFESFNLELRYALIDRAACDGHVFLTVPNRLVGKWRKRLGFGDKKSGQAGDIEDVMIIREMSKHVALKAPGYPNADKSKNARSG